MLGNLVEQARLNHIFIFSFHFSLKIWYANFLNYIPWIFLMYEVVALLFSKHAEQGILTTPNAHFRV